MSSRTHLRPNSIAKSLNGWTNGKLGYEWLMKVFDPATREEANGLPRVLLLDGHSSHYSQKFLDYARANNIILRSPRSFAQLFAVETGIQD
jgi:hypothetical protein